MSRYANYSMGKQKVPCIIRMLIFEVKFQKKSAYYMYKRRVNKFICNFLYMILSSNSVLRSEGCVCIFFLEGICDIVFGLFGTKIKQLI